MPSSEQPRAMFIGRWQPFHKGHEWLIRQKLDRGVPVLIAVRDMEPDEHNPFTTAETLQIIRAAFAKEPVEVIVIPDIESVNWGRGVGWQPIEHVPPADIARISATEIRRQVLAGETGWLHLTSPRVHGLIAEFLTK